MDERTEQGRRFLMGYRDDDTTEFVSDQEKKLPQPPLCKAPMGLILWGKYLMSTL